MVLQLAGKTKHGKNRIREQGSLWIIISQDADRIELESLQDPTKWRFIDRVEDPNFEIVQHIEVV